MQARPSAAHTASPATMGSGSARGVVPSASCRAAGSCAGHAARSGWSARWIAGIALLAPGGGELAAATSLYGVPEPPTPAPLPTAWVAIQDDLFGDAVLNNDDDRTGGGHIGLSLAGFVATVDDSAFTSRGNQGQPAGRTDELTYTIGYALIESEAIDQVLSGLVIVGGGGRSYGDFDGQRIQNSIHNRFGFQPLYLPYDHEHGTAGLGYIYARSLWLPFRQNPHPLPEAIGLQVEAAALDTTKREQEEYASLELVAFGTQGVGWLGVQYQRNAGTPPTMTAGIVARHENGFWLTAGLGRQPGFFVSAAIDPASGAIDGNVGVTIAPTAGQPDASKLPVAETFIFFPEGGSIGAQVRWQPLSFNEQGPWRHDLLVDYHYGSVPHYSWYDNRVDADQVLIGYEPEFVHAVPGIGWLMTETYAYVAAGVRVERVRVLALPSRFPQATGTSAVGQGGGGVRLGLNVGDDPRRFINQIRFGIGYDGWIPVVRHRVEGQVEDGYFLKPGAAPILSIGFNVIW